MSLAMTRERLQELAAAYGGDPARWPAAERDVALRLLEACPDAEALLREARDLDMRLALPEPAAPTPALRAALLRSAPEPRVLGWREAWSWRLALPALALSLTLGIGLGFAVAPVAQADDGDEDVLALAQLDDDYTEFTEP
jgi:hypothetical protein